MAFLESHTEYLQYQDIIEIAVTQPIVYEKKHVLIFGEEIMGLLFFTNPRKTITPRDLALSFL